MGNNVTCNTHCHKIQEVKGTVFVQSCLQGDGLCQFETDATNRSGIYRDSCNWLMRIEDGHRSRQFIAGKVVVADDHVNALAIGIGYLFHCLDTTIQCNDECTVVVFCIIYPLKGNAIPSL